jgi:thiosulfate dehydrogenase [quinone] large subunit
MSRSARLQLHERPAYPGFQLTALVALRILVGWHFLYEGFAKLTNPYWTSAGYLQASQGPFAGLFEALSAHPAVLGVVDHLNQWGLLLIGLALIVGSLTRLAAVAGIALLSLYYLAAPPLPGLESMIPTEGSYLLVNKVLVEIGALLVLLAFPTSHLIGLDHLFAGNRRAADGAPGLATEGSA